MPEATIVLTVFNEAPYVGEMIDSVLSSSVKKCYIVDNNSSDGTQEIIHSKSDNEIMHVYYLDEQRALFDNLSFLASMVEDKYIYILGGDDLLVKEGFNSVIDESNVGGYLIPRVHYFSDKSGCIVEEYPVKNWVDSCNTAKTSYQLIYAQLMYASNDVHILGLHDKNNFLRIYSSCKVKESLNKFSRTPVNMR